MKPTFEVPSEGEAFLEGFYHFFFLFFMNKAFTISYVKESGSWFLLSLNVKIYLSFGKTNKMIKDSAKK